MLKTIIYFLGRIEFMENKRGYDIASLINNSNIKISSINDDLILKYVKIKFS